MRKTKLMKTTKLSIIGLLLLCLGPVLMAQSLERKVFSNGGNQAIIGIHTYSYTFGEPIIGTANSGSIILTKGFHQPIDISLLPLSLVGPFASLVGRDVQIDWKANLEIGEGIMMVERSQDGKNFESIAEIDPKAQNGQLSRYQHIDEEASHQNTHKLWYRISTLSFGGEIRKSEVVSVLLQSTEDILFTLYPNPNIGIFTIRYYLEVDVEMRIQLLNGLGQTVWKQSFHGVVGQNEIPMQLTSLPSGTYFVVMQSPKQQWTSSLVIKH